ncbi:hypothetical protein SDRG_12583 [Saprolegnia diclina VS20]|uniref:MSP domain-containing protein n=1 Tax=Saprolegnia diclina (strain VS20) TaxID=1156394 RepID=T0PVQ0_SAPDV|nr:hypothetical protein SDRG_12583 [Saprolegnia diclina VS20]EQC29574.1 hypothetical protein SDRG_12583 [Saprolegnia diclina VS20]|eukprot:XP_008616878.1 hypothetical protein SDRG_12583 [Saprolegnia diclina VS20]
MGNSSSSTEGSGSSAPHGLVIKPSNAITFALAPGSAPQVVVKLKNTCNNHNIAFKVKTTHPARYVVKPTHGVLPPQSKLLVTVVLQPAECDDLLNLTADVLAEIPDKFQLQWLRTKLTAPATLVEDDFRALWSTVEKKHIHGHKLPCRFTVDNGAPEPIVEFGLAPGTSPEATLIVTNPSATTSMAFKVKTTRPTRYRVRPNQGVLRPGATATVLVVLERDDCDDLCSLDPSGRLLVADKFLLQATPIDDAFYMLVTKKGALEGMDELSHFWGRTDKATVCSQKIAARYVDGVVADATTDVALPLS